MADPWWKNVDTRGYENTNYYDSAVPYNENLTNENFGKSLAGSVGHFNYGNRRPPPMLDPTGQMGASNYQAPAPVDQSIPFKPDQGNVAYAPEEKKGMFSGITGALLNKLPRQDPRQVALTKFYGGKNNLQGGQTIQGGLMAGYNPVSGGLLNKATFGKFGDPTNYGLQRAYDKRIGTIENTLSNWRQKAEEGDEEAIQRLKTTSLIKRQQKLQADKAAELEMLNKVQTGQGGTKVDPPATTGTTTYGGPPASGWNQAQHIKSGGGHYKGHAATAGRPAAGPQSGSYGVWKRDGGRIGYAGGELVDEDINIQGPGFDVNENMEMAEGKSAFEMRIDELVDTGMSWQQAYQIAAQEFGMAEGQEDSFSEEGIASLV